jgi:hypothetical protein
VKQWNSFLIVFTAALALFWCSSSFSFVTFESFKPKYLSTDFNANYFSSTSNYAAGGREGLPNGNSFTQFDLSGRGRYVLSAPRWALLGGAMMSSAKSQGLDSAGRTTTRTNTALSEFSLGAQYHLGTFAKNEIYPEVVLHYPLEKVSTDAQADTVPNSEGVYLLSARMKTQRNLNSWRMFSHGGFGFQGQGRSTLLQYGFGFDLPQKNYMYGAEVSGYETVSKDSESKNAGSGDPANDRNVFINRVLGGSKKYYSYNPSLTNISAFIKYGYKPWMKFGFGGGTSLRGANTANGYFLEATLSMSFDLNKKTDRSEEQKRFRNDFENQKETSQEETRFQEFIIPQTRPSYNPPLLPRKPAPKIKKGVEIRKEPMLKRQKQQLRRKTPVKNIYTRPMEKQKTKLPIYPEPEIQEQLNNTEFQINLKNDRKRR